MDKMTSNSKNSNRQVRVLAIIISKLTYLAIGFIIAINIIVFLPPVFGYQVFDVVSGSMEPAIKTNSIIYVQQVSPETLAQDDIITYNNNGVITHRVVNNDIAKSQIITKGDANVQNDLFPVSYSNIVGKVCFSIPYAGYYVSLISNLWGKILILLVVVVCLLVNEMVKKILN